MDSFSLTASLQSLGLDANTFGPFIVGLLEEEDIDGLRELLGGLDVSQSDKEATQKMIVEAWGRREPGSFRVGEIEEPPVIEVKKALKQEVEFELQEDHKQLDVFDGVVDRIASNVEEEEDEDDSAARLEKQLSVLSELESSELGNRFSLEAIFSAVAVLDEGRKACVWSWTERAALLLSEAEQLCAACKPCRHKMQGGCMRADCAFDHNLQDLPCRFWLLQGGCLLAESGCQFAHGWQVFLPLLSALPDNPNRAKMTSGPGADVVDLEASFPPLSGTGAASVGVSCSSTGNSVSYRSALVSLIAPGSSSSSSCNSTSSSSGDSKRNTGGGVGSISLGAGDFWVDSGSSVAGMYSAMRDEARQLAIARNKLLEEATRAFQSGQRAQAKALASRGRQMCAAMHAKHAECARAIFASRNPPSRLMGGVVDLHGLHCAEAEALLLEGCGLLTELREKYPLLKYVDLVCGSGNHTLGPQKGRARLLPAVEEAVRELGLRYSLVRDPQGFVGGLRVTLGNN